LCYVPKSLTPVIKGNIEKSPYRHNPLKTLENEKQFLFMRAEMDDTIRRKSKEYYLFEYRVGANTDQEIQNLFVGLSFKF
jgi:hypothetical protein